MSLAIATLSRFLSPLWMPAGVSAAAEPDQRPRFPVRQVPAQIPAPTPLRVSRVVENRMPRHLAGRMVISGRIDEVCRELARLEALGQELPH
jgi:hypothetical protein